MKEMSVSQRQEVDAFYDVLKLLFARDLKDLALYKVVQRIRGICVEVEFSVKMLLFHYHERGKR